MLTRMKGRIFAAAAVAAAAAVGWLAWGGSRAGPTDEEAIAALFADGARAAQERRLADAVAGLSERFRSASGWDRREVKRVVAAQVLRGEWVSVTVAGLRTSVEGDRARSAVHLVAARSGQGSRLADLLPHQATGLRVDAELEREGGEWKVVAASHRAIPVAEAIGEPAAEPR